MALLPGSNLNGLPSITADDLKSNDPSRLNRVLRLLASQLASVQAGNSTSTGITNQTLIENISTGGGGSGSGGSTPATATVVTVQGTHAQRLGTYIPELEAAGTYYYETDRTATYLNYLNPAMVQVWQYVSGTMISVFASRPGDLTQYDAGFLFYATDLDLTYLWNGSAWALFNNFEPTLADTHANRKSNYPSVTYAVNTLFFETDRMVIYIVQNASGTVNTAGTAVTWASDNHFVNGAAGFTAAQWPAGTPIVINGVTYTVSSVASATSLTLTSSAGVQAGVNYSVASGRWVFATGEYLAAYASKPTDIAENDANFVFNDNATYYRSWTWSGSAWSYSVGQPPYLAVQMTMVNTADPGWHAADGSAGVTVTKSDATTTTVTLPNPAGYWLEGGTYTGTQIPAVKSTINPVTPAGSVASTFTGNSSGSTTVQSGAGASVAPVFTPSGSVASTFTGTPDTPTVDVEGAPPTIVFAVYVKL